jgi:hypothetical protein
MHVGLAMDAIKKQGHFKSYKEAHELYVEHCKLTKQAKAALAELNRATSKGAGTSRKSSKKAKEAMATADATEPNLQADFLLDLKKAREGTENAKAKAESAANNIFQNYANLLSVGTKCMWNKIIQEQMQSNPCTDL